MKVKDEKNVRIFKKKKKRRRRGGGRDRDQSFSHP